MDGGDYTLREFYIPESLDYRSLLRPPGPDDAQRLDASEADDPENWSSGDAESALGIVTSATSGTPEDVVTLLTQEPFCHGFNLSRAFANLDKTVQLSVSQAFAAMSSKLHDILEKIPPNPYTSLEDVGNNALYMDLDKKVSTHMDTEDTVLVKPRDMGQVLRSLCHLAAFLVCTAFRCALATPKESEKQGLSVEVQVVKRAKITKGSRKKKMEDDGKVDPVALELLVDSMLTLTKSQIRVPFSGEYGGGGRPDLSLMRLLLDTLMVAMGSPLAGSIPDKMGEVVSRLIEMNYKIMEEAYSTGINRWSDGVDGGPVTTTVDGEHHTTATKTGPGSDTTHTVDDADNSVPGSARTVEGESCTEWISSLTDEVKKTHCTMIADALGMVQDRKISDAVVKEILINLRDMFLLQISGGNVQLMSSAIQLEYANVGIFIERVGKKIPSAIVQGLEQLRYMFDVPSYNLRKSIIEVIKMMIVLAKSSSNATSTGGLTTATKAGPGRETTHTSDATLCARNREQMLQMLLSRQYDTYMYARAALLKAFQDLIELEALPIRWFVQAATLAISRLLDRGSQVRQRALNMLIALVQDTTTKRFRVTLNIENIDRDLALMGTLLNKLDLLSTMETSRSGGIKEPEVRIPMEYSREDGTAIEFDVLGGSIVDEAVDPITSDPSFPLNMSADELIMKRQKLLDELNVELSENIKLNDQDGLCKMRTRLEVAREMYSDVHEIADKVEKSIQICADLLQSSVEGDQRAAIRYLATCHLMGITAATMLLPQVWALSWSNNQNVVDTVLQEFKNVYFHDNDETAIAWRLIELLSSSRLTAFACIEKIFEVSMAREQPVFTQLDKVMVSLLRIAVAPNYQLGRDAHPRIALGVVRLLLNSSMRSRSPQAKAIRQFDEKRISAISGLLKLSSQQSCTIFGELCLIMAAASPSKHLEEAAGHVLKLFVSTFGSMDDAWFRMAQCVVDLTFNHAKLPETLWSQTLGDLLNRVTGTESVTSRQLAQVIFVAGHVAIRTIIAIDRLQSDLKTERSEIEALDGAKYQNDASTQMGVATSEEQERDLFEQLCEKNIVCDNLLGGPVRNLIVACLRDPHKFILPSQSDNTSVIGNNMDNPRVTTNSGNGTTVDHTTFDTQHEIDILKTCAAIALCKYATVSKQFCNSIFHPEDGLPKPCSVIEVIVSLLMNKRLGPGVDLNDLKNNKRNYYYLPEPGAGTLRATLLMSYGDLLCRHPNLLEPWNDEVGSILLDKENCVREAAVLVFTHLVMNDMVKPRGKLIDAMMYLTLDTHVKVAHCAKTFFHEVHRKNPNTIYNCFPEMVATLAQNRRKQSVGRNLQVLQMLLKFIRKDKQGESIVEKVCQRLHGTEPGDQPALVIYGHVLMNVCQNEKCIYKLIQSLPSISRLIVESEYFLATMLLVAKRAKSGNQGRRPEGGGDTTTGDDDNVAGSTTSGDKSATTEGGNIKELAEELLTRLHALFGEGKSAHVNQVASSADSIVNTAETVTLSDIDDLETLFIKDFGCVTQDD
ncbi:condensin subunit [Babesia ovis]|uniref:Condensin subunit n=1 Tax=Babesia ovis TaxID=5869 RepID=A0A9W5TBC7_BABOV|nr:condensin subunit [Babesia ovis]